MRKLSLPFLDHLRGLAPLVLRLDVGLVFVVHAFSKLTKGPVQFSSMLTGLGSVRAWCSPGLSPSPSSSVDC